MSVDVIPGRVHYADNESLWFARGPQIFVSVDGGKSAVEKWTVPMRTVRALSSWSSLGRRALRSGVHHIEPIEHKKAVVVADDRILVLSPSSPRVTEIGKVVGSRPLSLEASDGRLYYGEYRDNRERSPVHVFSCRLDQLGKWIPVWRFEHVRHIHGVYYDSFWDAHWVTTGDSNDESGIWVTRDRFRTLERVIGGSQQTRAVRLLFEEERVLYGSDAPEDQNHLYALSRQDGHLSQLGPVSGPVFHGGYFGHSHVFSTVAEPSSTNVYGHIDLVVVDGNAVPKTTYSFEKDRLPPKLFQYGQAFFSKGPVGNTNTWVTPFATNYHDVSFRLGALSARQTIEEKITLSESETANGNDAAQ